MRFQLGMLVCLLAGCATQPTSPTPLPAAAAATRARGAPPIPLVLRIGIEHLPPDDACTPADEGTRVRVEAQQRFTTLRATPASTAPGSEPDARRGIEAAPRHTWQLSASDLAAIDDPVARETMRFVNDLVDQDRRRENREAGTLFLAYQYVEPDAGPLLPNEETLRADHEEWMHEHGPGLLQRPLRRLLRRLPIVQQFELDLEQFRSDNVPLSEPYSQAHGARSSDARLSLRLLTSNLDDPVEFGIKHSGVRIASSQQIGKLSVDWGFTDRLQFALRGRTEYETGDISVRADLTYWASPFTSLHLGVGEDMDFLSTSSIYSLYESSLDGTTGLVFYAVHIF
ncbi:MAG TPA: hypothetical protein VF384_10830 [Planctomycetota bacterium]